MATNQKKQRKCRLIAKLYTYTRLGFPRGVRSWKWPSCAVICGGRDTVLLRSFASSSLDLFAGRCGVVACRFRSLSISPSLSCSIAVIVNRVYYRHAPAPYIHARTPAYGARYNANASNALAMKTTLMPHLRICPYKGSVATVQIQMPFQAIAKTWPAGSGIELVQLSQHQSALI